MKHTKKFLARVLTVVLVVMTLFSTMSVGFTATAAQMPESYTQEFDLGGDSSEAPEGDVQVETPEKKPEEDEASAPATVGESVLSVLQRAGKDIASVGANVDIAATGWTCGSGTIYFDAGSWSVSNLYFMIGHGTYSECYKMTKDTGTIYKVSLPSGWDGATEWCIINAGSGWGSEGNSVSHRKGYATNASSVRTSAPSAGTCYTSSGTKTFTITVSAGTGGTVSGGGSSLKFRSTTTIKATANTGYSFSKWNDGNTSASRTITVTGNATYTATFTKNSYTITVSAGTGGTVSGGGTYEYNSSVTIKATPNTGYNFVKWDDGNTSASRTITVTGNKTYTASFAKKTYTVTWLNGDGSTLETDTVEHGGSATCSKTPTKASTAQYSYTHSGWDKSATNVTSNLTITPTFSSTVRSYTITVNAGTGGKASGGGTYKYGTSVTLTATPNTGYNFSGWSGGSTSSNSSITITVSGAKTYTANFTIKTYTVTFKDDAAVGGGTLKTQTVNHGSAATAPSMSPSGGWEFYEWDKSFSNITANTTVTAVRSNQNVQLLGDGNIGGWSTGTARRMTYNSGGTNTKTVTLPKGTYELKVYTEEWGNWLGNNGTVNDSCSGWDMYDGNNLTLNASGGSYTFTYTRSTKKLSISYSPITYTVTIGSATGGSGSAGKTTVNLGDTTTLSASASKGYHFSKWTIGSNATITSGSASSASLTIQVNGNVTCTPSFAGNEGTVTYKAGSNGSVSSTGGSVTYPSEKTSTASPSTGYSFSSWSISGGTEGTDYTISTGSTTSATIGIKVYTAGKTITATANFTANKRTINFVAGSGGTVSSAGGAVTYPSTTSSTAKPNTGYHFTSWSVSGGTAGTDYKITSGSTSTASITVQPLKSGTTTFTANFQINSYTVTFVDHDGKELKTQTVTHGSSATPPADPSRTGYTFTGWSPAYTNITGNTTITAQYKINTYDVTLTKTPSAGGSVSANDYTIDYNKTCTITATPNEGYSFVKWEITSGTGTLASATSASTTLTVKSNITVRATFDIAVYTVNFRDHADFGGEIVNTQYIEHGSNATAPASSLINPEGGWEFYSWGNASDYQNVKKDLNIYAVRSNKNVQLLGDGNIGGWSTGTGMRMTYNSNGTSTKTVKLPKGTYGLKIYTEEWGDWHGNNGTVVDTTDTTAPAGWDMDGGNNLTLQASGGNYTFTYYRNTNKLKITYSPITYSVSVSASPSAGGTTTITQTSVHYGDTTTLKATAKPGYTFSKWTFTGSPSIKDGSATSTTVTIMPSQATTATANFTANTATVKYASSSGGSVTNMGDNSVTYPNEVKSTATANNGYTFSNWNVTGGTKGTDWDFATGDANSATIGIKVYKKGATITATAIFTANAAVVNFTATEGGSVTNAGNNTVTYPNTINSTATAAVSHNFTGWTITGGTLNTDYRITAGGTDQTSITIQPITGKKITATANFTIKQFTVTFVNWDGSKLAAYKVNYGADAAYSASTPTRPSTAQYSYTFKGWDKTFTNITSDLTVTAQYTEAIRSYTVTFKDYDGEVLKTQTVEYGKGATAPSNPSRSDGWIFDKWDKAYNNITGDTTVTAVYWDNNVYLMGVTGSWTPGDSGTKMSYGTTSSMTLTLNEGEYEFKFVYKGYWQGNNGTVTNTTDENGNSNPWETYDGNNIKLKAIGGTYRFTFNKDTWRFEVKHTPITYTVKFFNEGTLLSTQTIKRGENATAPANPTKAADAQYTYTFSGWDKSFTGVRSNLEINAVYTKTVNKYVVTFKDHDGTILNTQNVEYGSGAIAPANPTRDGYTFAGWDKAFNNITGALTVTAKYTINTYTVKFVNWNGTELKSEQVEYGKAATAPENPTRPADAQYTYTFKGWDKAFNKITDNITVTATYTQTVNSYTVKFVNWDGHVYKTQTVEYGKSATAPSNPTRNDGWTFIGWDSDAYKNVQSDLTITAQWTDNNVYLQGVTGTWDPKASGTKMSYGNISVMSLELAAGTYEFKLIYGSNENGNVWWGNGGEITDTTETTSPGLGWEMSTSAGNCKLIATGGTYTFRFNKNTKFLIVEHFSNAKNVTFKDYDGTVLATAKVEEGKTAASVAPADPTRNATAEFTYTFAGWTPSINSAITQDTTFTATYTETKNKYTVTFTNWDGTVLATDTVEYGANATSPSKIPTREADAQYTYTFNGWDKPITNVTANITVIAQYKTTVNKYDVTFKYMSANGKTEMTEVKSVEYRTEASAPTVPARTDGWTFIGWDKDFHYITGALTVTAKYRNDNIYLVLGPKGSDSNWNTYTMSQSGDVATYSVALVPGTYQFKLNQDTVWYGNWGTFDDTTDTTSASGWDMNADAGNCTMNASGGTYTFTFNNATKKLIVKYVPTTYTVKFVDWDDTQIGATQTIAIGKPATAPADPTRESTVSHDYTFTGWSEDFSSVTKDMVIKAQYKETLRKYTVVFSFIDADGNTIITESQQVEYGTAATEPKLPLRPDGQALRKWDKDFSSITGDLTVTAEYFDDNAYIKGGFNNWDNTGVLQTYGDKTVSKRIELAAGTYEFKFFHDGKYYTDGNAGTVPDTTGETWWNTTDNGNVGNTKLSAKGGWYTFTWNTETHAFKIAYEPYMYTVTFKDYDGEVLDTQQVAISTAATAPATPTRNDGFVFDYWDTDFSSVKSDLTVTAVYYDNNVYLMGINGDWTTTNASNRLTNKGTQNVVELTLEIGKTAGDTFTQSEHEFKFKQHNTWYTYRPTSGSSKVITDSTLGSWYHTSTNEVDNRNTVLKASGGTYTFKFATDSKDFNIHYDAIKYEVIFYDYAMNVLKKEMVGIGQAATAPDVPTRTNGFKFLKWDKDFSCITDRTEVYARYYDDKMYLSGDFNNWGTTALGAYGDKIQTVTMVLEPGSYDFAFFHNEPVNGEAVRHYHTDIYNGTFENETTDGWWDTKKADGGHTTLISTGGIYTFSYNTETHQFMVTYVPNVFDVTFVYYDADGKTLIEDTQEVKLGEDAIAPEVPVRKDGWVFDKWDKEFTNIQGDLTVTAEYIDENVYFTAMFNNWNEKATPLQLTDNKDIVKITLEFTPGVYEFKLHKGDGWYSYDGTIADETTSAVQMSASVQNNAKLDATGGYYTFTYNKANDTLAVSYEPYMYTVTFVDYDDKVLKTEEVAITKSATAPADPVRNDGFVFIGWDKNFDYIQSDLTVKAQYKDDNVYLMGIDKGWTKEDCNIMKSSDGNTATYTIRNVSSATTYEFKFLYEDVWYTDINAGTVDNKTDGFWSTTDDQSVGNTKLSASGGSYVITFNKTNKTFQVEHKPNIYHVTFNYYGKTYLEPKQDIIAVEAGGNVELPLLDERTDRWFYLFWAENVGGEPYGTRYTETITNVTQDMVIQAWYFDDNAYLIGNVIDGQWFRTQENLMEVYDYEAGTSSKTIHLDPGQYEFKVIHRHDGSMVDYKYGNNGTINDSCFNWDMSTAANNCVINATGGTYTFTFNRRTNQLSVFYVPDVFTVTFVDEDGTTVLDTQQVQIATSAKAPEMDEVRDGYRKFDGWDKDFSKVYSDMTVKAQYFDDNYYLKGSFNNWDTSNAMGPYGDSTVVTGVYLEPGTYTFKINHNTGVNSTEWFGSTTTIHDYTDGIKMSDDANCTISASGGYYIFKYTPSTNTLVVEYDSKFFNVVFKDWNGTILSEQSVQRGNAATAPAEPTREGDVEFSYIFAGWDKDFSDVQSDMEITATYTQVKNQYKVTFVYYEADGQTKTSTDVMTDYGTAAVAPEVPARTDSWVFNGWDKDFSYITGDLTVEALYINGNIFLVGDFNGWNDKANIMMPTGNPGEFSTTIILHNGQSNEFKIKVGDGWFSNKGTVYDTTDENGASNPWDMSSAESANCTIDSTGGYYTFIYNVNTQKMEVKYDPFIFTVNFYDYNDVLLKTEQVEITKSATAPDAPTRGGGFIFKGWDPDYTKVMSDLDVYAKYYDDNLYLKGSFNEWGTENMFTKYGDEIVTTTIELEPGTYTFKFFKETEGGGQLWYSAPSETIVDSTDWKLSEDASNLGDTILIANGGYYTFTFNHENNNFKIDYKPYKYEVTFVYKDADGVTDIRTTQTVDRGQAATAPTLPFRPDGFEFNGWDKDFSYITEDITVTASYFDNNIYVVGSFNDWTPSNAYKLNTYGNTEVAARVELAPGQYEFKFYRNGIYYTDFESATFVDKTDSAQATKTDGANTKLDATGGWYTFTFNNNNEQFTIAYEPYVYTVNFLDWNGSVLKSEKVEISKDATAPADPTREHYNFIGWDKGFTNIQGDLDVNATYAIHTFEVTFVYFTADCKETSTTQTVDYGAAAKAPELPRRQDGWVFTNWDKDFSFITEDTTVTALYIDDNVYLVGEFNNWHEKNLPMNLTDDPNVVTIKITLDEGEYDFKLKRGDGWYSNSGDINNTTDENGASNPWYMSDTEGQNCTLITAGGNYTFIYNKETQRLEVKYSPYTFVVTFVDWDGSVLKEQTVDIGTDASAPLNPTRPDEGNIVYTFKGWDKSFSNVKEDLTVTAVYEATSRLLTVTFVDWDGEILKTEKVEKGKDATPPETPTREGNAEFKYTFSGWDPSFKNVQTDITVTATYIQEVQKYTVTFVDHNDKVIDTQQVEYGKSATAPQAPDRGDNYIFTGWQGDFSKITEDTTIKATYGDNKVYLKGEFNNWSTSTPMVKTGENTYEVQIELPDGKYEFKINQFITWYGNSGTITDTTDVNGVSNPWFMESGDQIPNGTLVTTGIGGEYKFIFNTETQRLEVKHILDVFTVTFQDADGTVLKQEEVEYGHSATAPADPTAPEGFKFAGWDTDFSFITGDTTVTAVYTELGAIFEVIFVDWDGTIIQVNGQDSQLVEAGTAAIAPEAPTREGDAQYSFNFIGWDKDFSRVSENMTITAQYEQVVNQYEVKFVDWDGRTLAVRNVEYGKGVDNPPADPIREGFLFTGWDKDFSVITESIVVTAQYADQNQLFTVKFWNHDGSVLLHEETVSAGSPATAPAAPERKETAEFRFVFTGWDKDFSAVMSDMDVYPVYNEIKREYTVTFKDRGEVVDIVTVEYGGSAVTYYEPTQYQSGGYIYTFSGWNPNPIFVTGDMTVTAQYRSQATQYTVQWVVKGEVVKSETVSHGKYATPPTEGDGPNQYKLATGEQLQGWHTGNGQIVNNYQIYGGTTFIASILNTTVYIGGDFTTWGWIPMTPSTDNGNVYTYTKTLEQGVYEFKHLYQDVFYGNDGQVNDTTGGWWSASGSAGNVTLNATGGKYTFEFNKQTKQLQVKYEGDKYTVTFQDWNGTVLDTQEVERGKPAKAPANPYREPENGFIYTFDGWDKDFSYITENTVVTAKYSQSVSSYTVTFQDWNGIVLKTEQVEHGGAATAPDDPTRPNYQFTGWSREFTNVTSSITVEAQYEGNLYNITVNASQGGTASTDKSSVRYDDIVTLTANATGENNFKRWTISGSFQIVSGSTTTPSITIRPTSDIVATATFGEGVNLTVHSYSTSGYEYLFIKETDGTNVSYPAGNAPGTKQPSTTNFNGVNWKTSNELEMTRGYYNEVIANLTNGNSGVPAGNGNLVIFNNTLGWSNVHLYTSANNIWNGDNGCTTNGATHYTMTRIGTTNYWYAYVSDTASILFMKDQQDAYNNIHNTSASYRTDYNKDYPTFTPNTTSNQSTNGTTYYSNGNWSGAPSLSLQSNDFNLQNVLYKNGVWAGVEEVWLYHSGGTVIITIRRDLLDLVESMTDPYNNGVNPDNMYTEESWATFVDAYEIAKEISGSGDSDQSLIDDAEAYLQEAYDALELKAFHLVKVTQTGMPGTVVVNSTTITAASGTAQVNHNGKADISVSAPNNYYISGIIANGDVLFSNTNQSITARAFTINSIIEDVELEVQFERKLSYTITVHPYDINGGTLYYGDTALNAEGDAITVFAGENVTITATAKDGYAISRWVIDQTGEFYKNTYTFASVKENHEIAIEWQQVKEVILTVEVNPVSAGTASAVSGNDSITTEGSSSMQLNQYDAVTLTANATDPRYIFESWEIEGDYSPADNSTRFDKEFNIVIIGDVTATANYIEAYRKIYLENTARWGECWLYFWGSQLETDEWPGTKMEIDPVSGYYVGYIPYDTTDIQFNNGTNQKQVEFSDVTPNLYRNGGEEPGTYVEPGYYLQGAWNGANHTAYDLEKFTENPDGTYSITITVTHTNDGYIYVNPTNELSHFWNAEFDDKTDNPQILTPLGKYTDTPNEVKVEIDLEDFDADYDVKFTFDPDGTVGEANNFWWEIIPKVPTIKVIATDGRGTNSSDNTMVTNNDRVGKTLFDTDTVVKTTTYPTHQVASVVAGEVVTFSTQVNRNGFGTYDYYVYGWVINGTEFVFASNMGNGLYTGSYIFTQDNSTVVPVYYHTEEWLVANNVKQVTVYAVIDKNIENWDKYISTYTWYNNGESVTEYEQYGPYPGQLMVPIAGLDGVYYTYVELTSPAGLNVSGIVFGNYAPNIRDDGQPSMDTIVVDYTTIQTYDYYDFIALLEDGKENITFVVKNTNDKYNASRLNGSSVALKDYNFVQYTDYSGLKTDIFGTNIESINATLSDDKALYIIQAGDKSVHSGVLQGDYYVQCFIFDATGKFLGSCYSYELHDKDSALWNGILAPYKNQRAYFSYEAMNGNRYDGEWYGDSDLQVNVNVSVNVGLKVEENITINETEPVNKATYGEAYVNATEQNVDIFRGTTFTLTAVPKAGYRFVGWYSQNGMLFSTNISYIATSAVGATYTAVFEELDKESFYVNHYLYTGVGTTSSYIPKPHNGKAQLYVGIKNVTMGVETPLTLTETASISARVGDKLLITVATDAIGADKFFAWYVQAQDKYGFTSFEEVGVDSYDNIYNNNGTVVGRNDMVYFQFEYTVKENVHSMTLYSDLVPVSVDVTLEYKYNDYNGDVKSYYVPYTLTYDEIIGFAGNNFTPYLPAYISGEGWINTVLTYAPHVDDIKKDTIWTINEAMYDKMTFVFWATQPETLYTITSQVADQVIVIQKTFGELCTLDAREIIGEETAYEKGFWYNDINNNGKYDQSIDIILTYGPRYGYRITSNMNINYDVMKQYDFNIFTDAPGYGREQTSNEDGSNKVDKVNASYVNNILTPYFYDGKTFKPNSSRDEVMGAHVTIQTLRELGYTVNFGMIFEQVGSFEPGTDKYPTFEDALKVAQEKNYGVATDHEILKNEVLNGYKKPVMTSTGTYCTVYDTSDREVSNKNRFMFTISFNNTMSYQKRFYNVYSYVTVTTPEGVTNTYISNVQTLNLYNIGTTDAVVNGNTN